MDWCYLMEIIQNFKLCLNLKSSRLIFYYPICSLIHFGDSKMKLGREQKVLLIHAGFLCTKIFSEVTHFIKPDSGTANFNSSVQSVSKTKQVHPTLKKCFRELIEFMFICMTGCKTSLKTHRASQGQQLWSSLAFHLSYLHILFHQTPTEEKEEQDYHAKKMVLGRDI